MSVLYNNKIRLQIYVFIQYVNFKTKFFYRITITIGENQTQINLCKNPRVTTTDKGHYRV